MISDNRYVILVASNKKKGENRNILPLIKGETILAINTDESSEGVFCFPCLLLPIHFCHNVKVLSESLFNLLLEIKKKNSFHPPSPSWIPFDALRNTLSRFLFYCFKSLMISLPRSGCHILSFLVHHDLRFLFLSLSFSLLTPLSSSFLQLSYHLSLPFFLSSILASIHPPYSLFLPSHPYSLFSKPFFTCPRSINNLPSSSSSFSSSSSSSSSSLSSPPDALSLSCYIITQACVS